MILTLRHRLLRSLRLIEFAGGRIIFVIVFIFLFGIVGWFAHPLLLQAQNPAMGGGETASTAWRMNAKDAKYVGPQACAKCHKEESAIQHKTAMGKALEPAATSEILRSHPRLTFRSGLYFFQIIRDGNQSIYSVTDGVNTFSTPILYSFGQGKAGQTYVFQNNGSFYESRLSFYRETQNLDWTIGYNRIVPPNSKLDEAAGRPISIAEARSCFACHATAATSGTQLHLERMIPGVTCEACHSAGGEHIALMEAKKLQDKRIFNPGKMSPDELSQEFCGSCHRSAEQVAGTAALRGIISVRFQPYRLFLSRGHDPFDARLTCTACHNPHGDPVHEDAFYDAKCFACHRSGESLKSAQIAKAETDEGRKDKACPVGRQLCVACHMPKVGIEGSHFKFTDHRIRIVKPGESF